MFEIEPSLSHYLVLSGLLFGLGAFGVLMRQNLVVILMSLELMLNAVNLSLISFSSYRSMIDAQVIVFFVMTVAAAEAAVGLALVVAVFKRFKETRLSFFGQLKG